MIAVRRKYSELEQKELLKSIIILIDSREQQNTHITEYFKKKNIVYRKEKLDYGDYGAMLPKNDSVGIIRDTYIPLTIERKNSIDELASSFKDRNRFENEFLKAKHNDYNIKLVVEDHLGLENILNHNYRSEYSIQALIGSIKSFECKYDFTTVFIDKALAGFWIYTTFYYNVLEYLKWRY